MKHQLTILIMLMLCGCESYVPYALRRFEPTAQKTNNLSVGMSKDQAILIMGNPTSTSAPGGGEEILIYELTETRAAEEYNYTNEYYVRVVGGLVESYGRMGNCDTSTRDSLLLIDF